MSICILMVTIAEPVRLNNPAQVVADMTLPADLSAELCRAISNVTSVINEVGYFPVRDAELGESRAKWLAAMGKAPAVPCANRIFWILGSVPAVW